jgi:hypothetical protein
MVFPRNINEHMDGCHSLATAAGSAGGGWSMSELIGHVVGDFLLQNRWMAANKHANPLVCGLHSLVYAISCALCVGWLDWRMSALFMTHMIIDSFKLGEKWRRFYSRDSEMPWAIMSDQAMHLLVLLVLAWCGG